jgi:hypothetical protein
MHEVIDAHHARAFAWGQDDCCLFVARAWDAMTDSGLEQTLAALYHDEPSARALIAAHSNLQGAVSAFLGEPQPVRAARGAAVLFDGGEGDAVGICRGADIVAMGPTGLRALKREDVQLLAVWPPP